MSEHFQIVKPNFFYKYKPIDDYLFELLETNTFYFSDNKELNDFYDLRFELETEFLKQSMVNTYIERKLTSNFLDTKTFEKIYKHIELIHSTPNFKNQYHEGLFEILKFKICCFTTNKFSSSMWTFYANYYNGVVLEFDFRKDIKLYDLISKVYYKNEILKIRNIDDISRACIIKMHEWRREKEWRIIIIGENNKAVFHLSCLMSITFGFNVKPNDINKITGIINSKYKDVKLYQLKWDNLGMKRELLLSVD